MTCSFNINDSIYTMGERSDCLLILKFHQAVSIGLRHKGKIRSDYLINYGIGGAWLSTIAKNNFAVAWSYTILKVTRWRRLVIGNFMIIILSSSHK